MKEPLCKYFGICGGCDTQHIEYSVQLQNKVKNIAALLKVKNEDIKVFQDKEFEYRNRMDFLFSQYCIGLRGKNKKVIGIEMCPISSLAVNKLLDDVRRFFLDINISRAIKYAVVRASKTSSIGFIINEDSKQRDQAFELIKEFSLRTKADNVVVGYVPHLSEESTSLKFKIIKGKDVIEEELLGKKFLYHSQAFFQNNSKVAEKMIGYVKELLSGKNGHLVDLYGGVGTFGLCNEFDKITIIEEHPLSVECARKNILINNVKSAEAIVLDAKKIDKIKVLRPLHVITDPPRTGMDLVAIKRLTDLKPETIIYVSCNPTQFRKEFLKFAKAGYSIKSVAMFDMFPQTNHTEMVVEMKI
jgi:23S rRNA (uracil-5-)-methyltransferase RumA